MAAKRAQLAFEPVSEIPETASVCHFDEIAESLQEPIVRAEGRNRSTVTVAPVHAALLDGCGCDIVKFTEYYRVSRV